MLQQNIPTPAHNIEQGTRYLRFQLHSNFQSIEDIENLVIHRNRTTHGTQQILDKRLCETAFYLIGLIYCMILHSLGVDDTQLKKLCQKHFLSE